MENKHQHMEESVKTGLRIESNKPDSKVVPTGELLKKDPDELSHELLEEQTTPIIPTEKDMDDLIHSQRPQKEYDLDKEQDVDDLLHDSNDSEEELP